MLIYTDKMFHYFCAILLIIGTFAPTRADDGPIIQLPKGKIRGHILKSENGNPFYAFQEIPYAAPPVGNNRFQIAKEPKPWTDIRNATKNTVICYQNMHQYPDLKSSEDCLYINVYTPVKPGSIEHVPVLVWIHGGAFAVGSGTYQKYGTKYIMDSGIVVVTFNYRLGPFGFLTTDDEVIPANLGLKDQHLALEWVQENIQLFGGDRNKVTIAGQSAGSGSVSMHLMGSWQNNRVLYSAAILQSGSELYTGRSNDAREEAFKAGHTLDRTFNSTKSTELLKVLQKVSAEDIMKVVKASKIIEKSGLFSCQLYDCLTTGNFKKVPILIGFNSEENINSITQKNIKETAAALDQNPAQMLDRHFNISSVNRTVAGNLLRRIYTNTSFAQNIGRYIRWKSDSFMSTPILKHAELEAKHVDVFLYQFSHKGPLGGKMNIPYVEGAERVAHAEDLHYMWDDESNSDLSKFPDADKLMLQRYVKLWTNFVKYHNPTPKQDSLLQNVIWPKVDPKQPGNIQYLNMNMTLEVLSNPRYYQKVKKVMDTYITPKDIL